ncbi:MAG: hypothetical protein AB7K24_10375 [Gemmataceae bacterium]
MPGKRLLQYELDSMLRFGVVCSVVWAMGIGSLYAIVCGYRAKRMIDASDGELTGMGKARWCLIVGGIGLAIWGPILIVVAVRAHLVGH